MGSIFNKEVFYWYSKKWLFLWTLIERNVDSNNVRVVIRQMSVKMVRKNLGWGRDTLYSNVSTECLLQRVSDRHGENSSLYSLVVDHLCGHLPGERADWSISVNLAAERDRLIKPSICLVTREIAMYAASTSFLFIFFIFLCRAVAFSQRGKFPCSSACNTRELVVHLSSSRTYQTHNSPTLKHKHSRWD